MSRRLWLVLLAVSGVAFSVPDAKFTAEAAETVPATLVQQGDAALLKFDLDAALKTYRAAWSNAPTDYEAAWKLARALVDQGTLTKQRVERKPLYVEAEQVAREAVRLNPKDVKGHVYLAIAVGKLALFEGGKRKVELSKEIKVEAEKAIALNLKEDLSYHVLGIWHREMVQLNWALKKFAEFLYGKFPAASMDEALKNLRQATELAPNTVAHRVELGVTFADTRKWNEAATEFEKALELPKTWVTDDHYKDIAKQTLERVKRHRL